MSSNQVNFYQINIIESPPQIIQENYILENKLMLDSPKIYQRRNSKILNTISFSKPLLIQNKSLELDKKVTEKIISSKNFDEFYNDSYIKMLVKNK